MTALGDFVSPILLGIGDTPQPQAPVQSSDQVLTAIALLAGADMATVDASALAAATSALAAFGLENEARLLAVEALAARGNG